MYHIEKAAATDIQPTAIISAAQLTTPRSAGR